VLMPTEDVEALVLSMVRHMSFSFDSSASHDGAVLLRPDVHAVRSNRIP
jgi:hypothetical protein